MEIEILNPFRHKHQHLCFQQLLYFQPIIQTPIISSIPNNNNINYPINNGPHPNPPNFNNNEVVNNNRNNSNPNPNSNSHYTRSTSLISSKKTSIYKFSYLTLYKYK
jgi:hypothetical protein